MAEKAEVITLTTDEQESLKPSFERLAQIQAEGNAIMSIIQPFLALIVKNHGVSLEDYALTPDGKSLVLKPKPEEVKE